MHPRRDGSFFGQDLIRKMAADAYRMKSRYWDGDTGIFTLAQDMPA
ncbi:MAG: hypothetical protein KKI06_13605 [Euryarchaeota archaeon]|nr:hypothetical protein [Euryarchaeota archaeon]